jgi:hypothetical protein
MSTAARDERTPPLPDLGQIGAAFDFVNGRVTLSQRGQFEIRPREMTLTLDTLELLWYHLHTAALQHRGLLQQVKDPRVALSTSSGSPSDLPRNPNGTPS